MKRQLVAFCGRAGSGKSYSSDKLRDTQNFRVFSFADKLRDIAYKTLGLETLNAEEYTKLKSTLIYNNQTFRNILENLGESIRQVDADFWANACIKSFKNDRKNICVCDLRHANEYIALKNYCTANKIDFKIVFCDYRSERYDEDNKHESAQMANFLCERGYKNQQIVDEYDILIYKNTIEDKRNKNNIEVSISE